MSFLKIELDLPNFEKEININITINKDGEVVYKTTTSSPSNSYVEERSLEIKEELPVDKQPSETSEKTSSKDVTKSATKKSKSTTSKTAGSGGNFMNAEF